MILARFSGSWIASRNRCSSSDATIFSSALSISFRFILAPSLFIVWWFGDTNYRTSVPYNQHQILRLILAVPYTGLFPI